MTHPLDEALAEARRALALDAKLVAAVAAIGAKPTAQERAERDVFFEKWTRIEKALVASMARDAAMETMASGLRSLRSRATPGPWRRAHHGTFEIEAQPNQVVADFGIVGRAEADRELVLAMENALHDVLTETKEPDRATMAGGTER